MTTDTVDFSKMTDDELRAYIEGKDVTNASPGQGVKVSAEKKAGYEELQSRAPKTTAEEIEPSALARGFAAMGGRMREPFVGLAEKAQLAFPGAGEAGQQTLARIAQERQERRGIQRQLEETPAGQFGGFVGQTAPFALAPQTVAGQAALAGGMGFLSGGADRPTGIGGELATSALSGVTDAAATGVAMKGLQLAGKGVNAARGKYTPEGELAMELDRAARRLGLPPTTIGQLDPLAPDALRASPDLALQQARALAQRLEASRKVPSPAGGMEDQVIPGGVLKEGVEEAIKARKAQASQLYDEVDTYVSNNGLQPVDPLYSINTLAGIARNPQFNKKPGQSADMNKVFQLLDGENPAAFQWLKQAGDPKVARAQGMTFAQYKEMRQTVNGVLEDLRATAPKDRKGWHNGAIEELSALKSALDNDVERWGKQNADNPEAIELFRRANAFYRDVAAPATKSDVAVKSSLPLGHKRGFKSIEEMYGAVTSPTNRSLVERLLPTASRETRDTLNVLQNLPDVGATLARGKVPSGAAEISPGALVRAGLGHPALATLEMAPGARWLSSKTPAKALYFGATPTNRALGPAAQYPAGGLEQAAQHLLLPGQTQ